MATRIWSLPILEARNATGCGHTATIKTDENKKTISVTSAGLGAGETIVVKCKASTSRVKPDFSLPSAPGNEWDFLRMTDLDTDTVVVGNVGVVFEDADETRQFSVDTTGIFWVTLDVTTISDPTTSVTATLTPYRAFVVAPVPVGLLQDSPITLSASIITARTQPANAKLIAKTITLAPSVVSVVEGGKVKVLSATINAAASIITA